MDAWFEAFRQRLGLADGALPNASVTELPSPPTYSCAPRQARRHTRDDDPDTGPGAPDFNPAKAPLRREGPHKRPLERESSDRQRKEVLRQRS
jgi:hypothetical protein